MEAITYSTFRKDIRRYLDKIRDNSEPILVTFKDTNSNVVDGDTIIVELGGVEQRVRLIGVDTPESVHPDESRNTEAGNVASDYTKSIVKSEDTVYLQKDVSDTDKYDRLLRYVWLEKPTDVNDESEVKTKMLNAILVAGGYAEPKEYEPDTAYADVFERLDKAA